MKPLLLAAVLSLASIQLISAQSTIFFVRHAEKAQDGDAKDPDISEIGRARAEALAKTLKDARITAIYATEFKRTQQTATPLAHASHVEVTIIPAKETEELIAKLKAAKGNALVVGHSNTLPDIMKALGVSDSISIADNDYDDLFVISTETQPPQLLHLHYH
ncbi:MAG: phosphoglycerate mutase family protein [Chthoniobacterales bacterium]